MALVCAMWWAPPAAATEPLETFAALPGFVAPKLSPDGKYIAAKMSLGGVQYIGIMNMFDAAEKPIIYDLATLDVGSWFWVNDDWLVLRIGSTSNFQGSPIYLTRAMSISRVTRKTVPLAWSEAAQHAGQILWSARDGSPHILMARQTSIYSNMAGFWPEVLDVDVSTGKTHQVIAPREEVLRYYADGQGIVRLGYGYSRGTFRSRLLYREAKDQPFRTIDRADLGKHEGVVVPVAFLPQAGQALVTSDKDGYEAVYRYDLLRQSFGEKLFAADGYDIDDVLLNDAHDGVAGVAVIREGSEVHWLDPDFAAIQKNIDAAVGKGRGRIVSWNRDHAAMIVKVGGADQAGAYYFYWPSLGKMQRIAWVNDALKMRKLAPVRTFRYKARDGMEIAAVLTLPQGAAKNLPLIMLPHGGPEARDDESWDWIAQFLADRGYAVIQPNYRGSTGYGSAFEAAGVGQWGLAMQDDLLDGIAYLAKEGIADPKRVCIVGGSHGGYAAMRAAERDGGAYRCAVSYAGVSDLKALRNYDADFLEGRKSTQWLKEHAPDFIAVSPINRPQAFTTPILLIHGRKDLRVPVAQSRQLAAKLKAAGKTYRYVEQPEADHFFSRQADRVQYLQELEAFLKQYNPA